MLLPIVNDRNICMTFIIMAALQNTMHVSEHSPDGKFYALINHDGKLQIWDTETSEFRQEYVPKAHLSAPFVCLTWVNATDVPASKTVCISVYVHIILYDEFFNQINIFNLFLQLKSDNNSSLYVALGTKKGSIILYSFAKADVSAIIVLLFFWVLASRNYLNFFKLNS